MVKIVVFIAGLLAIVAGLRLWFYFFEGRTLYYPMNYLEATPADLGIPFEEGEFKASDGVSLHGWYLPSEARGAKTILFLHGNAGNISHRLQPLALFHKLGLAVLILDYRGYGKSGGKPSEKGLYRDAAAAYEYLLRVKKTEPTNIILFGESLGGAVAIELASKVPVGAVVCEGTFSSALDMGNAYFPFLPIRLLLTQKYDAASKAGRLSVPKIFIHSRQDEIVPYPLARKLFEAAQQPKEFVERSGGHNNYLDDPRVYERVFRSIAE